MEAKGKYSLRIHFQDIDLPPCNDILILGKKSKHGKIGISKSIELLAPDSFKLIEINDPYVEALLINKKILKRMSQERIIEILKTNVFPYISINDIVKVDLEISIHLNPVEIDME